MSELRIRVTGRNLDVGDALRATITQNLQNGIARYSNSRDGGAIVTLSKERHLFVAEIILHLDSKANFEAKAGAPDPHAAFAQALDKIEKRARRHKRKATDHHSVKPLKVIGAE